MDKSMWALRQVRGKFYSPFDGYVRALPASRLSGIYTCTSNGALRLAKPRDDDQVVSDLATLPMRLSEWRLSESEENFAYTGDEVELSVWNTELAFSAKSEDKVVDNPPKKRKRNDELLPGEIWRAKNVGAIWSEVEGVNFELTSFPAPE